MELIFRRECFLKQVSEPAKKGLNQDRGLSEQTRGGCQFLM